MDIKKIQALEVLGNTQDLIAECRKVLIKYIRDATIPIEDRWNLFITIPSGILYNDGILEIDFSETGVDVYSILNQGQTYTYADLFYEVQIDVRFSEREDEILLYLKDAILKNACYSFTY